MGGGTWSLVELTNWDRGLKPVGAVGGCAAGPGGSTPESVWDSKQVGPLHNILGLMPTCSE